MSAHKDGLARSLEHVCPSPGGSTDRWGSEEKQLPTHLHRFTQELQEHQQRQQREAGDVSDSLKTTGEGWGDLPHALSSVSPGRQAGQWRLSYLTGTLQNSKIPPISPSSTPLGCSMGVLCVCFCVCVGMYVCVCIRGDGISPETVHLGVFMHV